MSPRRTTVEQRNRYDQYRFYAAYAGLLLVAGFILQVMRIYGPVLGAALFVLITLAGVALVRPDIGLGVAIALAVVGDGRAMPWWPVVKNFSSRESALYVSDGFSLSPFELVAAVTLVIWWLARSLQPGSPPIILGPFWRPLVIFTLTIFTGLVWGLGRGGDLRVALFEVRPLLLIPLVYLTATNVFTTLRHYRLVFWGVFGALTVESLHTLYQLPTLRASLGEELSPLEHTAALHMNLILLLLIAVLWFGTESLGKRALLFLLAVPTVWTYLEAERRASVVGLAIGVGYLAFVLFAKNRQKFKRVIPVMVVIGVAYVGAFWTVNDNPVGFPAQAIKIILQPDSASEKDASSDLYREIENHDLNATIRSNPVLGVGFGKPFLQPIPLPDISFFEFYQYIPHNSLLWIWTQVGFVGFVAFLYVFGVGTATGIRAAGRLTDPDDLTLVAVVGALIPMVMVVAFVDITFDAQTTVLFALALALVGSAERLTGRALPGDAHDSAESTRPAQEEATPGKTGPWSHPVGARTAREQ